MMLEIMENPAEELAEMPRQILKAKGWKSLRTGPLDCYLCPGCGGLSDDDLILVSDAGLRCFHCYHTFPRDAFKRAQKDVTFAVCAECSEEISLTPSSEGFVGFLCGCDNYVAIPFEDGILQPQEVMTLQWNEGLRERGTRLTENCSAAKCATERDWLVLALMQVLAKESNSEFKFGNKDDNEALLVFDPVTGVYVGYLLWYETEKYAMLNQLFVMPEQRRKGHAEAMVKHWVAEHAKHVGEQFALESPNEYAIALHIKLGHIRREGDYLVGVGGCVFRLGGL
jgi:GNAT superfamily N-acetyltransferase